MNKGIRFTDELKRDAVAQRRKDASNFAHQVSGTSARTEVAIGTAKSQKANCSPTTPQITTAQQ
jgi:hypothetical protein